MATDEDGMMLNTTLDEDARTVLSFMLIPKIVLTTVFAEKLVGLGFL